MSKRKPTDLTLRNLRATKKREAKIMTTLMTRVKNVDLNLASWMLDLQTRVEQLEAKK